MTKKEAADLLSLIADQAPRLREAGVISVQLGELAFELAPAVPAADHGAGAGDAPTADAPANTLRDPWTYGRPSSAAPSEITVKRSKL